MDGSGGDAAFGRGGGDSSAQSQSWCGSQSEGQSSPSSSSSSSSSVIDSPPPVHRSDLIADSEIVRHCDPVHPEPDLLIDTEALHQRYRFFEEYREPVKEPKRFIMTPPREVTAARSPQPDTEENGAGNDQPPAAPRDPNVVRCSDVVDDIPKTDTAKKMLNVFKRLESIGSEATNGQAKAADVIPVEPEMARSLRAKFENWTADAERDNNNKSQNGSVDLSDAYTPQLDTTRKMLSVFQQLEQSQTSKQPVSRPEPKPLKRITPPRDLDVVSSPAVVQNGSGGGDGSHHPLDHEPEIVRSSTKSEDVIPVEPEMARSLRDKFENWTAGSVERDNNNKNHNASYDLPNDYTPQTDTAKNLKAKFESFRSDASSRPVIEKRKPRVNRFVQEMSENQSELCSICGKILYALEKVEFSGAKMHKSCFKCTHCLSSLRLDNYTLAAGKFYCLTHFKQLFMSKGNYDEGFGREQHKEKWNSRTSSRNQASEDSEGIDSDGSPAVEVVDSVVTVS